MGFLNRIFGNRAAKSGVSGSRDAFESRDGRGTSPGMDEVGRSTTAGMQEVEQRMEQLPRMPEPRAKQDAKAEGTAVAGTAPAAPAPAERAPQAPDVQPVAAKTESVQAAGSAPSAPVSEPPAAENAPPRPREQEGSAPVSESVVQPSTKACSPDERT